MNSSSGKIADHNVFAIPWKNICYRCRLLVQWFCFIQPLVVDMQGLERLSETELEMESLS